MKQKIFSGMKKKPLPATSPKALLAGRWRITEMSMWDSDSYDTATKAFICIDKDSMGQFQFDLLCGEMDGEFKGTPAGAVFDFTWQGNDECDGACGDGWLCSPDGRKAEGEIRIHCGDKSGFKAKRRLEHRKKNE